VQQTPRCHAQVVRMIDLALKFLLEVAGFTALAYTGAAIGSGLWAVVLAVAPRRGDLRLGALERAPFGTPVANRHAGPPRVGRVRDGIARLVRCRCGDVSGGLRGARRNERCATDIAAPVGGLSPSAVTTGPVHTMPSGWTAGRLGRLGHQVLCQSEDPRVQTGFTTVVASIDASAGVHR